VLPSFVVGLASRKRPARRVKGCNLRKRMSQPGCDAGSEPKSLSTSRHGPARIARRSGGLYRTGGNGSYALVHLARDAALRRFV